ncbi:hypothetical protein OUZ56_016823 [Daphnia magna]|uniref:Uncharacterized protein n=1 Tax=Daphnia magna TaxID=35525 RepID=A0ABR0ARP8_9CRUS|nr:hypothetical protein OUZ56_016823 [Daphnia magna]
MVFFTGVTIGKSSILVNAQFCNQALKSSSEDIKLPPIPNKQMFMNPKDDKREVLKCKGKSAKAITDPISAAHFASNRRMKLVNRKQVYKSVNMARAKTRPVNPKTLDFSFEDDGIPDGLTFHDMVTGRSSIMCRHKVCYTIKQARLLKT